VGSLLADRRCRTRAVVRAVTLGRGVEHTAIAGPIRLQDWPEFKRLDSNTRLARPISLIEERTRPALRRG
jgi:hypothetical protein